MTLDDNKDLVRRFYAAFDRGDEGALDALIADDFLIRTAPPGMPQGREGFWQGARMLMAAFPERHTTVDLLIAEGELITAVHTHDGVQGGPYLNFPATGKHFRINGIEVFRIVDGRITEYWRRDDELGMLVQTGLIPVPARS
jgi:steroid delta-isomerase-like uncharacterized protein